MMDGFGRNSNCNPVAPHVVISVSKSISYLHIYSRSCIDVWVVLRGFWCVVLYVVWGGVLCGFVTTVIQIRI